MKKHKFYYRDKTKKCVKYYIKLKIINIIKKNYKLNKTIRQKIMIKSFNLNKNFNLNKLKKYCYFTGRLRFIINKNKVSRVTMRELVSNGYFSGFFKK